MTTAATPMCVSCARYRGDGTCDAYAGGIPQGILLNSVDHRVPQRGDGGLTYVPVDPDATPAEWWPAGEGGEA